MPSTMPNESRRARTSAQSRRCRPAPGARQMRSSAFCSSPNTDDRADQQRGRRRRSCASTPCAGLLTLCSSACDRRRALLAHQPAQLGEDVAARRVLAEDEAGDRDDDQQQRRDREQRVVRERCAHARARSRRSRRLTAWRQSAYSEAQRHGCHPGGPCGGNALSIARRSGSAGRVLAGFLQPQENTHDRSPNRPRIDFSLPAPLAVAGCGMMNRCPRATSATVTRSPAHNEVPPNPAARLRHRQGRARRQRPQVDHHVLRHDRPGHRRPLPRPGRGRRECRRRRCRSAAASPARSIGTATLTPAQVGRRQARPLVHQPAHRRQPGRRDARPGQVARADRDIERAAALAADPRRPAARLRFSSSRRRRTRRCTLPVVVIGRASMNSISFGYS